ncbi:Hypothetical_protein [Hexamita inflata]|uniref:Hypothetical_protein n=1 Tax=Hexamita inflata TaxID=28002 RepID=A0AA86RDD6_9EUKA|nr:Hypothetical protein HINF_LOCUS53275 [Hexamita inflata]
MRPKLLNCIVVLAIFYYRHTLFIMMLLEVAQIFPTRKPELVTYPVLNFWQESIITLLILTEDALLITAIIPPNWQQLVLNELVDIEPRSKKFESFPVITAKLFIMNVLAENIELLNKYEEPFPTLYVLGLKLT